MLGLIGSVMVIGMAASCTGTNASAWVGSTDLADPVLVVNADSITYHSYAELMAAFGPDHRMKVDARVNARADEHLAQTLLYDEIDPTVALFLLATNDLAQGQGAANARADQGQGTRNFGTSLECVVYMTVFGDLHAQLVDNPEVDAYNAEIRALDGATVDGVRIQVADWEQAVLAAGPANVIVDDVHPNEAGAALFIDVVAGAVDDCSAAG